MSCTSHLGLTFRNVAKLILAFGIVTVRTVPTLGAEVCFDDLGCFSDAESCHRGPGAGFPPDYPGVIGTRFLLFTSQSRIVPHPVSKESSVVSLEEVHLNASLSTKVIVHGWSAGKNKKKAAYNIDKYSGMFHWALDMKDAFLDEGDCNIILVDWTGGSSNPLYRKSVQNARVVGREIGLLLEVLHHQMGVDYADVHIIGMSLGAHVAGHTGEYLDGELGRITGLDPAGPAFKDTDPLCRLDEADAIYVDAIHTDINGLGISQNIGSVDFYPNGGHNQPGCPRGQLTCSHMMAPVYFTLSISGLCPFASFPCVTTTGAILGLCDRNDGCPTMGAYSDRTFAYGQLCVVVRSNYPHCDNLVEEIVRSNPATNIPKIEHMRAAAGALIEDNLGNYEQIDEEGSGTISEHPETFFRNENDNIKYTKMGTFRKMVVKMSPLRGTIKRQTRN